MAQGSQSPDDDTIRGGDDLDEVLSRANPNPERSGCPPRDTLMGLGRRTQQLGDPAYEHLVRCSPCYREFRALQQERQTAPVAHGVWTGSRWIAVAAIVVLTAGLAGSWFYIANRAVPPAPLSDSALPPTEVRITELDLRKFAVTRSAQGEAQAAPVILPIGLVDLKLLMPVGSEPGAYDIQLLDANLESKASARATGEIRDYVTTIGARLDLRPLAPGAYQLAVRRQGDDWRLFPARVQ